MNLSDKITAINHLLILVIVNVFPLFFTSFSNHNMRIATGGILHETSTCVDTVTTLDDFNHDRGIARNDSLLRRFSGTNVATGGFITSAEEHGFELVPLLRATAFPGGIICREDYETIKSELLERLENSSPVDGVLLDLHGAMVVDGIDDGDSSLDTGTATSWYRDGDSEG